jgi:hypothetical protein
VSPDGDAIALERQLTTRAQREGDCVQLRRRGETGQDQQRAV